MDNRIPTVDEIELMIKEYGWSYRRGKRTDGSEFLYAPLNFNDEKGILVYFTIEGEFLMVTTSNMVKDIDKKYAMDFLELNDFIKMVKLFAHIDNDKLNINLGFELVGDAINKDTFFTFLDAMDWAAHKVMSFVEGSKIVFDDKGWVVFEKGPAPAA
jgi:hypothetical protein